MFSHVSSHLFGVFSGLSHIISLSQADDEISGHRLGPVLVTQSDADSEALSAEMVRSNLVPVAAPAQCPVESEMVC